MNAQGPQDDSTSYRAREGSFDMAERIGARDERRQELAEMARGLRRMKRQLFLKHVEESQRPAISSHDLRSRAASDECKGTPPASPRAAAPLSQRDHPSAMD